MDTTAANICPYAVYVSFIFFLFHKSYRQSYLSVLLHSCDPCGCILQEPLKRMSQPCVESIHILRMQLVSACVSTCLIWVHLCVYIPIPFMQITAQVIVKEASPDWWPLACARDKYIKFGRLFHRHDAHTIFHIHLHICALFNSSLEISFI